MNSETDAVAVGIVADDLTGANDSAVQFARGGWEARLTLADPSAGPVDAGAVIAVVTDSRAQDVETARASTSSAVTALRTAGIDRLFIKIDSTMRGSVSAQIAGALGAWSSVYPDALAIVCPAYPAMGRTVERGRLLVDGAGVETTSVGRDPVTPVVTSEMERLVPGCIAVSSDGVSAAELAGRIETLADSGLRAMVIDAASDEHLRVIGDAIVQLGARAIPVGSAGLAGVMSEVWGTNLESTATGVDGRASRELNDAARVLVQVSSLHDVSRAQHAHLVETGDRVRTFAPGPADVSGADAASAWIARELADSPELPEVVVVLAPTERGAVSSESPSAAELVAAGLAAITDKVLTHSGASALVLMGGEGARAVLDRFDADAIRVTDAIREGIPIGVIEGGRLHGLTVVTKAGGFGTAASLTDIVPELLSAPTTQGEHS